MKNFDSRVFSVADFDEWRRNGLLDLSPDFQRRSIWPEKAKSYLIDTIIRGKPMPKVLITQEIKARRNLRTVVDGQQRIRAVLGFIDGDFKISSAHNREFARKEFDELPEEVQDEFMKYEVGCDLLYDTPYRELLDIFARINTFTVKLNSQELLNAKYLGYFKQTAYRLGFDYADYFLEAKILNKSQISRMAEATLASDMLIALVDGVQTNKNMEAIYKKFEDDAGNLEVCHQQYETIMRYLGELYSPADLANSNWRRIHLFYSLFTAIGHGLFGLDGLDPDTRPTVNENLIGKIRSSLDDISSKFDDYTSIKDIARIPEDYRDFIEKTRRGTTDTVARVARANFICSHIKR